jgi:hypothetical protein
MDLTWSVLLSPFDRLEPFRERAGDLKTIVMRLANLIAKVDGGIKSDEVAQLKWLQYHLEQHLERIPLDAPESKEAGQAVGKQALQFGRREKSSGPTAKTPAERAPARKRTPQADEVEHRSPEERLAEVVAELDSLIGLGSIKQEVRGLVNFLQVQKARREQQLPVTAVTLHSVFSGNPGTGKTTVARLLGRIFGALGILQNGQLIETDRSGLVAEYAGQTGPKTHKKIDEALDGVLFIDEAYSLVAEAREDPYGTEAVQALLKRMEDDRERLIVVLAGYPEPMGRLLHTNPGLSSRFTRLFHFSDYSAAELGSIFQELCRKNQYVLPTLARVKLLLGFQYLLDRRDEHFGNGRLVRNVFERSIGQLANRIAAIVPLTRELLTTLQPEDLVLEGVPEAVWTPLASETRYYRLACPGCRESSRLPQRLLGCKVQCKRCQACFQADWGEVIADAAGPSPEAAGVEAAEAAEARS